MSSSPSNEMNIEDSIIENKEENILNNNNNTTEVNINNNISNDKLEENKEQETEKKEVINEENDEGIYDDDERITTVVGGGGGNRGDEGIIQGASFGDDYEMDKEIEEVDSDLENDYVIIDTRIPYVRRTQAKVRLSHSNHRDSTSHYYSRDSLGYSHTSGASNNQHHYVNEEELKPLRFNRHMTAFDIDINALDEHPWRNKNVDISDYFNYGFNEKTWMVIYFYFYLFFYYLTYSIFHFTLYRYIVRNN